MGGIMWITLEAHQDGQQHLTSPHHGLSRVIACGFLLTQTLPRNTGAAPGDECARTVFSLRCGIDCCGYLDDGTLKMGEGKEGSQVGILGSNKNKQDTCMQPRRLTHRRMIEGNTCTVLWCGSTHEVRRHGQAHLVGAIRSRSPACIFLIRTQIIGRCCCIISHQGVARPCAFGRQEVYLNAGAPLQLGRLSVDMFCASSLSETRTIS